MINLTVHNVNVSMQCGLHAKDFDYQWEKMHDKDNLGVNSHGLTITNVKPDDSGKYRCVMSNCTGKIFSDYISLNIKGTYVC